MIDDYEHTREWDVDADHADYYRMGEADHKARTRRRLTDRVCRELRDEINEAVELMMDGDAGPYMDLLERIKARVDFMVMS
jgi:hypothetical protein